MTDGADRRLIGSPGGGAPGRGVLSPSEPTTLADLLERVLDKGIVIAGDITLSLGAVEVLTLKIRLLIASVDKAQEIGINWWQSDPALSSRARALEEERDQLKERLDRLEARLALPREEPAREQPAPARRSAPGEQPAREQPAPARRSGPGEQPAREQPAPARRSAPGGPRRGRGPARRSRPSAS